MRVGVIGGGVIGLSCAHALTVRGIEAVVLDAGRPGGGASAGNAGWIVPSLSTPLAAPGMLRAGLRSALDPGGALVLRPGLDPAWIRWLLAFRRSCGRERYRRGVRALVVLNEHTLELFDSYRDAGIDFEMHDGGILVAALAPGGLEWFSSLHRELVELGHRGDLEVVALAAARALEPALSSRVGAVMRASVDRWVRPESLTAGLAAWLGRNGVEVRSDAAVSVLAPDGAGDGWQVTTPTGPERFDRVVVASGNATPALLRPLGLRLPILGAKGYSVTVATPVRPRHALYLSEPKIGTSTYRDGVRIAGFFELPARSAAPDARRARQLIEETAAYLDGWEPDALPVGDGWAGLRPATPDGLPLLGPVAHRPGLFVAAGHGMLGVTLAPATGAAIAAMISDGSTRHALEAFRPERRI